MPLLSETTLAARTFRPPSAPWSGAARRFLPCGGGRVTETDEARRNFAALMQILEELDAARDDARAAFMAKVVD